MNLSFEISDIVYEKMKKHGKANGRAVATEARYQLEKIYEGME